MFGLVTKHVAITLPIMAIASCLFLVQKSESRQVEERHAPLQAVSFPESIQSLREDISNPVSITHFFDLLLAYRDR